jgi:hypothetical protein
MSSWGANPKAPLKKKPDGYFFQPSSQPDICSLYNEYFDKCFFVKQKNKTLFLQEPLLDTNFKLLQNTFARPDFVEFVDIPNPYYTSFDKVTFEPIEDLVLQRSFAAHLFVLRNDIRNTIALINDEISFKFDVGIYIDAVKCLPTDHYISLLHKLTKGAELNIFIMSNNPKAIHEIKTSIQTYELPWNLYHSDISQTRKTSKKIQYIEFLSELEYMKHARILMCGKSTSVGTFLYRICDHIDNFIGIEP